jgi:hypothetical protein
MSETNFQFLDAFSRWMYSLDPVKLQAEESFVGKRHRQLLFEHELRRVEYQRTLSVPSAVQSAAAFWAFMDSQKSDTPEKTKKPRRLSARRSNIEARVEPTFTEKQLLIATQTLEKKRG